MSIEEHADVGEIQPDKVTRDNVEALMATHTPRFPLAFSFKCYGVTFIADGFDGEAGPTLQVSGNLGPLPYSAECVENRKAIGDILSLSPEFLSLRMSLSSGNNIIVEGELPLGGSVTPSRIVATASAFAVAARPLIEIVKLAAPAFAPKIQLA